jgi:hypothetical protein
VRLAGARIDKRLSLNGAVIQDPHERTAVTATGAVIRGDVELNNLEAHGGQVRLRGAEVGGNLEACGSVIANEGDDGLVLDGATVRGDVLLRHGFRSTGTVSLRGLSAGGILDLTDAVIVNTDDWPGVVAVNTRASGGMFLRWSQIKPSALFDGASTSVLWDDPTNWPPRLSVAGFEYERFWRDRDSEPSLWNETKRIEWLAKQNPLDAGPYTSLVYIETVVSHSALKPFRLRFYAENELRKAGDGASSAVCGTV